jgi:ligand-binding SRPBCC domain-containing protein
MAQTGQRLQLVTFIAAPAQVCFDLSRSIDLHVDSMARSRERAVSGITSGLIGMDEEVTWEARHFGLPWRVTSRITMFEEPHRFVDEMTEPGPFRFFRHEHVFHTVGARTRMEDNITFKTRFGPPADVVAKAYLARLIRTRNDVIRRKAEGG